MKVLVTGGAGFIGSAVVQALLAAGHQPVVVDNLSSGRTENLPAAVRLHRVDILSERLSEIVLAERPEATIHLAAQVSVSKSLADPAADATANLIGTLHVLDACVGTGCRKLIYASSAAVYGDPDSLPITEEQPARPLSPYGASKHTVEHYLPLYREQHGLDFTVLRLANVYGPRQEFSGENGVTTQFMQCLLQERRPMIEGDGLQTRDFVYVGDVAEAFILALTYGSGLAMNIGSGQEVTILALLAELGRVMSRPGLAMHIPARPGDIRRSVLDCSRARKVLGWLPRRSLCAGLSETAAWIAAQEQR